MVLLCFPQESESPLLDGGAQAGGTRLSSMLDGPPMCVRRGAPAAAASERLTSLDGAPPRRHVAASLDQAEMVSSLLAHGADPVEGLALHGACAGRSLDVLNALLGERQLTKLAVNHRWDAAGGGR